MSEPRWLESTIVLAIHFDQIEDHGGALGLRDRGLLEPALARPKHLLIYNTESDLLDLAAAYGFGIARTHPFVDGNKRVAFQAMYTFLGLSGVEVTASEAEVVHVMLAVASGDLSEADFAEWLRERTEAL